MIVDFKAQDLALPLDHLRTETESPGARVRETFSIFIAHPSHFLTDHKPHGDGLAAYDLIRHLAERGHELHVAVGEMDLRRELPKNVELYPVKTYAAPLTMLWRLEYAAKVKKLFERLRQETPIDVIHQLNPVTTGLSLFLGKTGHPLVLGPYVPYWSKSVEFPNHQPSFAERANDAVKKFVLTKISHRQQQLANALLISTPAALGKICNEPEVLAKTHELPYSVDVNSFSPRDGKPNGLQAPNILFLANLQHKKGIYTLLEAFEIVSKKHPTCRLTIAGGGEEEAEIKRRVAMMKLESRVMMTGKVERQRVPQILRESTIYCLPSYGEPFGMSALEAMACGLPVVATDVGGLSHLITEEGGRKVPPRDAPALAAALLEIVNSPTLQKQMGQFNRAKALRNYTVAQIVNRLEEIYRQVIKSKRTTGNTQSKKM